MYDLSKIMFLDIETVPQRAALHELGDELASLWEHKFQATQRQQPDRYGEGTTAEEAFTTAAANGQKASADKQLGNIYLKDALAKLKAKDYAGALDAAAKSTEYSESSTAYQIAGQAAQLSGNNTDAVKYFEKYLELAPNAKNAGSIAYTVGALYQTAGNVDKAKEFYTKALSDPTYGPEAQKLLNALK